jgi:curved DNA-binding protein CbpA
MAQKPIDPKANYIQDEFIEKFGVVKTLEQIVGALSQPASYDQTYQERRKLGEIVYDNPDVYTDNVSPSQLGRVGPLDHGKVASDAEEFYAMYSEPIMGYAITNWTDLTTALGNNGVYSVVVESGLKLTKTEEESLDKVVDAVNLYKELRAIHWTRDPQQRFGKIVEYLHEKLESASDDLTRKLLSDAISNSHFTENSFQTYLQLAKIDLYQKILANPKDPSTLKTDLLKDVLNKSYEKTSDTKAKASYGLIVADTAYQVLTARH